ncbi:MAG: succinate dehydrogenase cytochrome b558 subunit [Planctomycetia bacterium]|nr:succinate dehydrogenase cytochrome b558 subunit [Planctomycetia bacterium]
MTSAEQHQPAKSADSFLVRHDFLLRRLHSLSGLIPVGAYMVVHLLTNATVLESAAKFQDNVYTIHSLGRALPVVEWVFIFIPLLFHALFGMVIIASGSANTSQYPLRNNIRYTLQRATGMIAFAFIMWHVFQMRGWIHESWWVEHVTRPLGGGQFRPYNAASTAGEAMQGFVVNLVYSVGILSCVYHLANGLWTMGITWGVWTTPAAQRRADVICGLFGLFVAVVGLSAQFGMWSIGREPRRSEAVHQEDKMWNGRIQTGQIEASPENKEKRSSPSAAGTATSREASPAPAEKSAENK